MKSKILGISIVASAIMIVGLTSLAIGQRGDSPAGLPQSGQEGEQRMPPEGEMMETTQAESDALGMEEIIDQEYSYEQKDELRQKVSSKVDRLNQRIDEIDRQTEQMRELRTELEKSLIRMEYVDQANWDEVQENVKETAQEVSDIEALESE